MFRSSRISPGRGAGSPPGAYGPLAVEVVHQVLAIDDEPDVVDHPRALQRSAVRIAVVLIVVGHQDRDRACGRWRLKQGHGRPRSSVDSLDSDVGGSGAAWACVHRQSDREGRTVVDLAGGGDRAVMALDDLAAQRQADTGPGIRARPMQPLEGAEDPRGVLLVEADPVVAHGQLARRDRHLARNAKLRDHVLAAKLQRVAQQVLQQLAHLHRVGLAPSAARQP